MKRIKDILTLMIIVVFAVSGCKEKVPKANFTYDVGNGVAPVTINFKSDCENAEHYQWTFDDELNFVVSTDKDVVRQYRFGGTYLTYLTVGNDDVEAMKNDFDVYEEAFTLKYPEILYNTWNLESVSTPDALYEEVSGSLTINDDKSYAASFMSKTDTFIISANYVLNRNMVSSNVADSISTYYTDIETSGVGTDMDEYEIEVNISSIDAEVISTAVLLNHMLGKNPTFLKYDYDESANELIVSKLNLQGKKLSTATFKKK